MTESALSDCLERFDRVRVEVDARGVFVMGTRGDRAIAVRRLSLYRALADLAAEAEGA